MNAKTNKLLAAIIVMQGLTLLGQWVNPTYTAPAQAQIPDAGAQRAQVIDELRGINAKLDKLIDLLDGGKVQVHVSPADDKKDGN